MGTIIAYKKKNQSLPVSHTLFLQLQQLYIFLGNPAHFSCAHSLQMSHCTQSFPGLLCDHSLLQTKHLVSSESLASELSSEDDDDDSEISSVLELCCARSLSPTLLPGAIFTRFPRPWGLDAGEARASLSISTNVSVQDLSCSSEASSAGFKLGTLFKTC